MADVHPFDLKSFDAEVQAQADLERLRAEIRAAEAERDRLREEARREGLELARKEAFEQAAKEVAREAAPLADLLRKAAAAVEDSRAALIAEAERDLVGLTMAVAAKVVKTEVEAGRPVAEANLRRSVELTARRRELRVLVHADDLARIEAFLPELRREFSDVQKVALEASPSVDRGGVLVQTREGSVDATLAAQLDRIGRGLLG